MILVLFLLLTAPLSGGVARLEQIDIHASAGEGRWSATYRFSAPIERAVFVRQGNFRRVGWRAETRGYSVARDGDQDAIRLKPKARPARSITISFPFDTTHPEKDYQLFQPFSDGSLLLYTGHLEIETAGHKPARFRLTPRKGEHIVVGGRVHRKPLAWTDPDPDGTYVYYGTIKPVESEGMLAVLDPGAPAWLVSRLREGVPALFADYRKLTGVALDTRPTVFLSFSKAADPTSTTWKGGTLTGIIQMHIETVATAPEDRPLLERFFKFLAHESAHLWNGQMFKSRGEQQSWMHEGGADAFAWRAIRRAGILTDEQFTDRQLTDLNLCLSALGSESLQETEKKGRFGAVYTCGSALAWFTEAALQKADARADLHTLWRELFERAAASGHGYDETMYLAILRERTSNDAALAFMDAFLHQPMPDRVERTVAAFDAVGVALKPAAEVPPDQRQAWGREVLLALMKQDCGGSFSFTRRGPAFVVNGSPACNVLKSELTVEKAEGFSLVSAGDRAYDAVAARCARGEDVTLEGGGASVALKCGERVRARPPWLVLR